MHSIRPLDSLTPDEVRQMGADAAAAHEAIENPYPPGSSKAIIFERAYLAAQREERALIEG